jgi:hypothetical protein
VARRQVPPPPPTPYEGQDSAAWGDSLAPPPMATAADPALDEGEGVAAAAGENADARFGEGRRGREGRNVVFAGGSERRVKALGVAATAAAWRRSCGADGEEQRSREKKSPHV